MATSFPKDFLWGAATAGHQIEGGNVNANLWPKEWAPNSIFAEPSGDACDSYHRYGEDIALLSGAGLNAYRFSLEWSRIEPEEGWFSRAALDHYRRVIATCQEHGVTPVVTYNHFTVPRWFAERGAWAEADATDLFARYAERVTAHLGDVMPWVCTMNESNIIATMVHVGMTPAGHRDDAIGSQSPAPRRSMKEEMEKRQAEGGGASGWPDHRVETMAIAHRKAFDAIKSGPGDSKVGWTLALIDLQAAEGGEERCASSRQAAQLDWLDVSANDDFVGVQTYTRERVGPDGLLPRPDGTAATQTGWEVYPEALEHTIRLAAARTGVPVLVTENGMATSDDVARIAYTKEALQGVGRCLDEGIDVRGYLHWTLLDNFEWTAGFKMTFGLIAVDLETFARRPKPSLAWLGSVARANRLD